MYFIDVLAQARLVATGRSSCFIWLLRELVHLALVLDLSTSSTVKPANILGREDFTLLFMVALDFGNLGLCPGLFISMLFKSLESHWKSLVVLLMSDLPRMKVVLVSFDSWLV